MSPPENRSQVMTGIGLRAHKGGAVAVCVTIAEGVPRAVLSAVLETSRADDRLSFEPYRIAAEMPRGPQGGASAEAVMLVAEGHRRQEQLATRALQAIIDQLALDGCRPAVIALLVNRAGWITDLLGYSLAWDEHVPVAEALAVRDALRFASGQCGIPLTELDEKSLEDLASALFDKSSAEIAAQLKALGVPMGRPWRKEQKLACLSAWVAMRRQHGCP
jgi:hypothetical protein